LICALLVTVNCESIAPRPRFPFVGSRLARISDPGLINTIRNCASETNFQDSMLGPGKLTQHIDILTFSGMMEKMCGEIWRLVLENF